jgi:hypothetical protein
MSCTKFLSRSQFTLCVLVLISTCTFAQTAPEGVRSLVPSVACDAPAVTLRILALERGSPGELRMEVEFESLANVPQSVNLDERRTALVDNTGYQYKVIKSPRETRLLSGRTRAGYVFLSEVGCQQARTVSMDIRFGVRSDRSNRPCSFVVPGIPIAEIQR